MGIVVPSTKSAMGNATFPLFSTAIHYHNSLYHSIYYDNGRPRGPESRR